MPRNSIRLLHKLLKALLFILVAAFPVAVFVLPLFASDAYPTHELLQRFNPVWGGVAGAVAIAAILIGLWLSKDKTGNPTNAGQSTISKFLCFVVLFMGISFCCFWLLTRDIAALVANATAKADSFYLTDVSPWNPPKRCAGVEWYEPTVGDTVTFFPTFPLFARSDSARLTRAAIVHILRGPSGIRILTVHALDTEFGQRDIATMRAATGQTASSNTTR
jgi:type IV secretory pathway VirB2 component (pilin)